jgi:hypothetical protein
LDNPSLRWEIEWKGTLFTWRYSDGSEVDFTDDHFLSKLADYHKRHPDNFAAEERPRMPDGFDISNSAIDDWYKRRIISFYAKRKVEGLSKAEGEKAMK